MTTKRTMLLVIAIILISGCATKRYPITTPLSGAEVELMTCQNLQLEIIKAEQVELQINETGQFDERTVFGFLGDFGIGNSMAKSEAQTALSKRITSIRNAQVSKGCLKPDAEES